MRKERTYYVEVNIISKKSLVVSAKSKAEAIRLARNGEAESIDCEYVKTIGSSYKAYPEE